MFYEKTVGLPQSGKNDTYPGISGSSLIFIGDKPFSQSRGSQKH